MSECRGDCRACPVCGATESEFVIRVGPERLGRGVAVPDAQYTYCRCSHCEATYLAELPPKNDLDLYYESDAYHAVDAGKDGGEERFQLSLLRRLQMQLARPLPTGLPGRHLDFGCGPGDYLAFSRSRGWEATGIEYSEKSATTARRRGFPVVLEVDVDTLPAQSFDLITMIHSLEHVPCPTHTLQRLVRLLKDGGTLMIEVPYLESHEFRIFGRHYSRIQAPVHLQFFTDGTMRWLSQKVGVRLIRCKNNLFTPVHYVWSLLNAIESFTGVAVSRRAKTMLNALAFPAVVVPATITTLLGMKGVDRQYVLVKTSAAQAGAES
jgi:SAM-dependent methyltransferase